MKKWEVQIHGEKAWIYHYKTYEEALQTVLHHFTLRALPAGWVIVQIA